MNDYKELVEELRITGMTEGHCEILLNAADAIEQLVKERDAAVDDLKLNANCYFCKWLIGGDCTDFEHEVCHGENWEWRGVQEADNEQNG